MISAILPAPELRTPERYVTNRHDQGSFYLSYYCIVLAAYPTVADHCIIFRQRLSQELSNSTPDELYRLLLKDIESVLSTELFLQF